MLLDQDPYLPIAMLLHLAIEKKEAFIDDNIRTMVQDAQLLVERKITIHQVHRSVYTYAVAIERRQPELVREMNPEDLKEPQFRALLDFFENL